MLPKILYEQLQVSKSKAVIIKADPEGNSGICKWYVAVVNWDDSDPFRAEKEGATSGMIKDIAGPLSLSGQLALSKNGRLSLKTRLSARESGTSLDQMVAFLGKKDASGRVAFNYDYQLWR